MNQNEGHSEPGTGALSAKEEAARDGVSVRTVYKRRAQVKSSERSDERETHTVPPLTLQSSTQVSVYSEPEKVISELKGTVQELTAVNSSLTAEVNQLKGTVNAYKDIVTRMLPATAAQPEARPGGSLPLWILAGILAAILIVGGVWIWMMK